ncbi:MAG: SIMPL domain-containing protein [Helicobacteraceae bacterium]|jgi:hypothetical protein|nr:SIMPL domain-containing protein [Helicobacteraceae bacterium]
MQINSAIVLGLSFVIGVIAYGAIQKWDASGYDYNEDRKTTVSIHGNRIVESSSELQVADEVYAEIFNAARQRAEAIAKANGGKLGKLIDVYTDGPNPFYDGGEGETKKFTLNVSATFEFE